MSSDFILIDNDQAIFMPTFGPALVAVQPGQIKASGEATFEGTKVCIEGDEASVEVPGCSYMTPTYPIPGTGTLYIEALGFDQIAQHTHSNGGLVLLKGSIFLWQKFSGVFSSDNARPSPCT